MDNKISIKQILVDLISIWPQIQKKHKGSELYAELISYLSKENYYGDEDIPYPTLKQIEANTKLGNYQIRKQLKDLYEEVLEYPYKTTLDFSKVEIYFHAEYFKTYTTFKTYNLKNLPRVGENLNLPFLEAKMGIKFFYVEDIKHVFTRNIHTIDISIKGGFYNSYWYYRKHKALEYGEIGMLEQYDLNEYELKKKVGLMY
ncbi:hypothetical protein WJN01_13990 [Flavobacteriaceae bacterium SZ-1-7]|uniref:hypothetical protein n=1 Tax=Tamlana sedimenti TaxID=3134126 RepID=UPI003128402F